MRGEHRRRSEDRDMLSGTAAALKTIYPPERAAQARFDDLIDQIDAVSAISKGEKKR